MSKQNHPLVNCRVNYNPVSLSKAIERENERLLARSLEKMDRPSGFKGRPIAR